ncbi:MAG: type VI secretion system baseplate subunit TssK [Deltaproteobacteria bacterium]|uniref:type VI secretion system baseplate subunit TssK n=1 Tax=Desulfobacula sp. TaxID=2593537 RepID=UPI00198E8181|nr:type VI secretion system baseplate subunit TssK [Candidatus Desulfobacula maris]MBL6993042.1 type VI secretion system baseplate subunit TssK [Desulfobacula sp.]
MNKPEKPLLWHQGLFLQPHHFQQNETFLKSLLTPHNKYHTPFFWGCGQIIIQDASLSQRLIEIEKCELIFQDGTWVKFPENAKIQHRSFEKLSFDVEGDKPVTVYLGIRKWNDFDKNVTSINSNESIDSVGTRYVSSVEPESVKDIHEGGSPVNIRKMDYIVKIFWDHEIDKFNEYLMIPVCQLELKDESVGLSRSYIAPTYVVSGSDILMKILKNLRENMISRCRVFESYKFSQGLTSDFDAHFMPHLLVLSALNRSLPLLNHIIELEGFHPHAVYGVLRQIIGDLSTFTDRINALGQLKDGTFLLPEYNHEQIFNCFNEAQILLGELLKGISIGGESIFSMTRENNYFTARLPAEEFRDSYMYFLVLKSTADSEQIINDMHNIIKIGTPKNIDSMIARALPGVPVKHRLVPPPGMPKRSGSYYFRIDSKHHLWEEIKHSGDISLFWDNAPEDTSIEIVISQI